MKRNAPSSPPLSGFLRKSVVVRLIGLCDTTLRRMEAEGTFPKRVLLGKRVVAWREADIAEFLASRREASPGTVPLTARELLAASDLL